MPFRLLSALLLAAALAAADWTAVPGHVAPAAGEHPRLFLRKADVPALRARAQTPEGKAIVARLRALLGGGEAVPASRNTGGSFDSRFDGPPGSYTLWHAAGFGTLYQITGEAKYAELAKECAELAWNGVRDRDSRYSLKPPAEPMRTGPALYAMALAYDLCYDGWDAAYREAFAQRLMTWSGRCQKRGGDVSLERLATRADNPNHISNHFALQVGGAGLTLLALKGDPGVDAATIDRLQEGVFKQARKVLNQDFGEGGYFGEHGGPGVIAKTWTFVPWLQAERVAAGRDWITNNSSAEWMTLRYPMQMVANGSQARHFSIAWAAGPGDENHGYGMEIVPQDGGHHGALFCQGFGAVRPEYRPALLWAYNTYLAPHEAKRFPAQAPQGGQPAFDVFTYPHRALFALVNWPFGVEPQNPGEVLPPVAEDRRYGQYIHRKRWQDDDDIIVGALYGARSKGEEGTARRLQVFAYGKRIAFSTVVGSEGASNGCTWVGDGSGVSWGNGNAVGVDFNAASGADAVVVLVGPRADARIEGENGPMFSAGTCTVGGTTVAVLTVAKGAHPKPVVEGTSLKIGGQTVTIADGKPVFAVKAAPWAGPRFRKPEELVAKAPGAPAEDKPKAGTAKRPGASAAGTKAAAAAPSEKARAADATMRPKLLARIGEAARGGQLKVAFGSFTQPAQIEAVNGRSVAVRMGGGTMELDTTRMPWADLAAFAVAARRPGNAGDAALAGYYLAMAGRADAAEQALAQAGAEGEAVTALFAP